MDLELFLLKSSCIHFQGQAVCMLSVSEAGIFMPKTGTNYEINTQMPNISHSRTVCRQIKIVENVKPKSVYFYFDQNPQYSETHVYALKYIWDFNVYDGAYLHTEMFSQFFAQFASCKPVMKRNHLH